MSQRISFLLSLAALPACGPVVENDPTGPDGDDPKTLGESCEAALRNVYGCNVAAYEEEDSTEYTDGEIEDEIEEYLSELCGGYTELFDALGDTCTGAMQEVFACLASLDCEDLTSAGGDGDGGESGRPAPCLDVYRDANQQCPEAVPFCQGSSTRFGGLGSCGQSRSGCLDDELYGFECSTAEGEELRCICLRDDTEVMTATIAATCGDEDLPSTIAAVCGFPDGVFFSQVPPAFGGSPQRRRDLRLSSGHP